MCGVAGSFPATPYVFWGSARFALGKTIKRLEGEESVIAEHFSKLSTPGQPGGDDPNNRNKWKDDIKRHIRLARKYLDKVRGDRNREPWE